MVTQKYELREETLRRSLKQREAVIEDHESGRKLLNDEVSLSHQSIYFLLEVRWYFSETPAISI